MQLRVKKHSEKRPFIRNTMTFFLAVSLLAPLTATAESVTGGATSAKIEASPPADFRVFKPRPSKKTKLDYSLWSELLEGSVVFVGPSTRVRPRKAAYDQSASGSSSSIGGLSRIDFGSGHDSPFRLEGNKVIFSEFTPGWRTALSQYSADLVETANRIKIARLPRNEQLAFWLNLHNAVMIDRVSQNYPVKRPAEVVIGPAGEMLHDAKVIIIEGQALSLRDIRENIVYKYWDDPAVIYGFFYADLSSPSIRKEAFTGDTVARKLGENGVQFVNSLRGTHRWGNDMRVAKLYADVAQWYFRDFHRDLKKHLMVYAGDEVKGELTAVSTFTPNIFDGTIADLIAGEPLISRYTTKLRKAGVPYSNRAQVKRFEGELRTKFTILLEQGKIGNGTVTIEDIETESIALTNQNEQEGAQ